MKRTTIARFVGICGFASMLPVTGAGSGAFAQEPPAEEQQAHGRMEEVIVTARKREESIQHTPIAITAFTGDTLDERGIVKLNDISQYSPNVVFDNYNSFGGANSNAIIYIRGIGQNDFVPTVEPGVGLYVDGVYLGRSVGSTLDLLDVERIEVLRGPQGTLFGRNTIGGAVNVVTRKPDEELGAKGDLTVGSDSKVNVRGSINLPFSDRVFARFSAASFNQDGYVDQINTGRDLGNTDTISARAALRWVASDAFELNLTADYSTDNGNGPPWLLTGLDFSDPGSFLMLNNTLPFLPCAAPPSNPAGSLTNPNCINSQYLLADQRQNAGTAQFFKGDIWGTSLTAEWQLTDALTLKSITAYRKLDTEFSNDEGTPVSAGLSLDIIVQEQVSQELQLLGSGVGEKLEWILGAYYFQEDGHNTNPVDFVPIALVSGGPFDNDSIAGFGQGTYHVTDQLDLTAGVRYTRDTKRFLPDQFITDGKFTPFPVGLRVLPFREVEISESDVTPMVNLAYQATPDFMLYGTYSEGFKGGGFAQRVFPPLPEVESFRPEFATAYELGFKYTGAEGRFRLNGAAFMTDYTDLQITVFTGIAPVLDNAGDATIQGFELEMQAAPEGGWLLEAAAGYLDPEYDNVDPATALTGNEKFERISDWTLSGSLSKEIPLAASGTLTPQVSWSYRTSFFFDSFNSTLIDQEDAYHLFNAHIAWDSADARYGVTLGGTNLTDEEYFAGGAFQAGFGFASNIIARGREWYLTARFSF